MTQRSSMLIMGILAVLLLAVSTAAVSAQEPSNPDVLRIATTTSLYDTGLLDELEVMYENTSDVDIQITSTGTGQAIDNARRGDVDLALVHAPELEQEFIDDGYGIDQRCFAYNNFIIVGPESDPAGIMNKTPEEAFAMLYSGGTNGTEGYIFVSRGDGSGTHTREQQIWDAAGYNYTEDIQDSGNWYLETGSGMGETLTVANQQNAYSLSDIGTFLSFQDQLNMVQIVTEGDQLTNRYSAIAVNPEQRPSVNYPAAVEFINWLIENDTKQFIGEYGVEEYGEPLFIPLYSPECMEPPFNCTCDEPVNAT